MIPNIVVPMPMPIHGGGNTGPKIAIAMLCAIFIIGLICYIIGYLKDGIRHSNWSLDDDNMWKISGVLMLAHVLLFGAIIVIGALIYSWL